MRCKQCGHKNAVEMKFCGECGTPLAVLCRECGALNTPAQKFCGECGARLAPGASSRELPSPDTYTPKHLAERILTSKTALEGERKQVTVLFADLKGSMELLADRDPEEARKLLDPVVERMMEAVHHFEGTVNQVMGDGIMALFGAPLAHEDHAARACYAALRMQDAVRRYSDELRRARGLAPQIRVGINSGDVVVRSIGSDLRMDYTAVGQTTHLAARMEQLAAPGTIRLTTHTLRLTEDFIQVDPLGPIPIKGLSEPVAVFELVRAGAARTRFETAARRGLTRFVGRSAELELLRDALHRASGGRGQVVAIVGEPGVGKSRLLWELTRSQHLQDWLVIESAAVSYGKATSYLPVIGLLKEYFEIQDRDELHEITEKVTGKLLSLHESLMDSLPAFFGLLDVPVDDAAWKAVEPAQRRHRTLHALRQLLLREARAQPLLLIFEDLHWIDGETQALLDSLVESMPAASLLLLVSYRPEYRHTWGGKTYYRQIRIDPLPPENADELLDVLLGPDPALEPLKQLLISRTEANPLFLEESVRALVETAALAGQRGAYRLIRPVEQLTIPPTVQAILAARIDRLPPEAKRLLQAASVIGRDVSMPLVLAIAEVPESEVRAELACLQAAEFLYETRLFPNLEYTFKHALTHEVTYEGLLQDRRRTLHAGVLEAMERLFVDRLGEHVERLAHHALRGGMREKAVCYLRQAGLKATARSALGEAVARFDEALSVLEDLPESRSTLEQGFDIRLDLRPVLNPLGEVRLALERTREAEMIAERLNDDHRRGRVCALITNSYSLLGEVDEALASGTRVLEIAGRLGDSRLRIPATTLLEVAYYLRADYERVIELANENLAALPTEWLHEHFGLVAPPSVWDRSGLAMSLAQLGRFAEDAEHKAAATQLAEPTHHPSTVDRVYRAAATLYLLKGSWTEACSVTEHWITVLQTGRIALFLPEAVASSAWALAQTCEATGALNRLQEGEQLLERHAGRGIVFGHGWAYHALGCACLLLRRLSEAERLGHRAVEYSWRQPGFAAYAQHLLGDIAIHPDRFNAERGEAHYRQALDLAEPRGMRPLVAHCHLGLGKTHRRNGNREQAQEHFTIAIAMYRDMAMTYWLEQAAAEARQFR